MTGAAEPVLAIEPAPLEVRRIVVLKLDHRGDFILATAAFEAVRSAFPSAHITVVCGPWNVADAEAGGMFDRVLGLAFFPEFVHAENRVIGDAASLRAFAALFEGERFDLAIDLRVHPETRPLLALLDAGVRAGFGAADAFPFLDVALPFAPPTESGRTLLVPLPAERFRAAVGAHAGHEIASLVPVLDRPAGEILVYGPYAELEAGAWQVELALEPLGEPFAMGYDVSAAGGKELLGAGSVLVAAGAHPRIALHLAHPARDLEVRLQVGPSGEAGAFRFGGGTARRQGVFAGPHQAEMQYLLCCLVGLRLRLPWRAGPVA